MREANDWLMGTEEFHPTKKGPSFHKVIKNMTEEEAGERKLRIIVAMIIDTFLYNNKNIKVFPCGTVHIVQEIVENRKRYGWASYILAQLYSDLCHFVMVRLNAKRIAHTHLLQC